MPSPSLNARPRLPWLTLGVFVLMEAFVIAQSLQPQIVPALMRTPAIVERGEYWRLLTALLVQADGIKQIAFNTVALLLVGLFAERFWPRWIWGLSYLAAGFLGQSLGLFWQPAGGGNSVAIAGVAGLALAHFPDEARLPVFIRYVWPVLGLMLACALTYLHDIHGPPLLLGGLIGMAGRRFGLNFRDRKLQTT